MPLSLTVSQKIGVNATYWKVTTVMIDYVRSTVLVNMGGYFDKTKQQAAADPMAVTQVMVSKLADFTTLMAAPDLKAAIDTLLSTYPEFAGSSVVG